jgi:polyribonucleotide nucleotidyltransferase
LLHISEIDWKRLDNVEDVLKEGDEIEVKLLEVEEKTGKLRLSRRVLLPKPEGYVEPEPREQRERPDRRDNRSGGRDGRDNRSGGRDGRSGGRDNRSGGRDGRDRRRD